MVQRLGQRLCMLGVNIYRYVATNPAIFKASGYKLNVIAICKIEKVANMDTS